MELVKRFNKEKLVTQPNDLVETCLIVSLYNSLPELFKNDFENVKKTLNKLKDWKGTPIAIVSRLNKLYKKITNNKILNVVNKFDLEIIKKSIDKNLPVTLSVMFDNVNGHAVTILGYDNNNLYYFENQDKLLQTFLANMLFLSNYDFNDHKITVLRTYLSNISNKSKRLSVIDNAIQYIITKYLTEQKFKGLNQLPIEYLTFLKLDCYLIVINDKTIEKISNNNSYIHFSLLTKKLKELTRKLNVN